MLYGNLVLIRMSGPCAVHQTTRFILFVFSEHAERTFVQLGIGPARIQRRHAANRQNPVLMTRLSQRLAQILEKRHVVRNRVSIRQDPLSVLKVEVDQTGHVVPAAEI